MAKTVNALTKTSMMAVSYLVWAPMHAVQLCRDAAPTVIVMIVDNLAQTQCHPAMDG